jgi:hypothetical protein
MAFFRTAGMVPLYSGEKSRKASAPAGGLAQLGGGGRDVALDVDVLVVEGDLGEALEELDLGALGATLTAASASWRLWEPARRLPTSARMRTDMGNSKGGETLP